MFLFFVFSLQTKPAWTAGSQPSATALLHCMSSSSHIYTHIHTHTHTQRDHVLRLLTTILTKPLFPPVAVLALFI